jgi:hypothetical protein
MGEPDEVNALYKSRTAGTRTRAEVKLGGGRKRR